MSAARPPVWRRPRAALTSLKWPAACRSPSTRARPRSMDEYVGIPRDHPESYHSYMWNNFFKFIDIDPANVNILDGNAADLQVRRGGGADAP